MTRDPLCGMEIQEGKATAKAVYRGKTYHFCAVACREQFVKAPAQYVVKAKASKRHAA